MLAILTKKTPLVIARKEIRASVFDKGTRVYQGLSGSVKMLNLASHLSSRPSGLVLPE